MPVNNVSTDQGIAAALLKNNKTRDKQAGVAAEEGRKENKKSQESNDTGDVKVSISSQGSQQSKKSEKPAHAEPRRETETSSNVEPQRAVQAYRTSEMNNRPGNSGQKTIARIVG